MLQPAGKQHEDLQQLLGKIMTTGSARSAVEEIIAILHRLLEQAHDVEAEVGTMPGADEALGWAIGEAQAVLSRLEAN